LGVTPAAEDVVIGAAYRALMRHYHPDTNSDPDAQARAQQITAAYAVLRDPASRAEYDASRAADFWAEEEMPIRRPPPMRAAGIATALLAVGLVGAVWAWQQNNPPARKPTAAAPVKHAPATRAPPPVQLKPENERLADVRQNAAPPPPPAVPPPAPAETPPVKAASVPSRPAQTATPKAASAPSRPVQTATPKAARVAVKPAVPAPRVVAKVDRPPPPPAQPQRAPGETKAKTTQAGSERLAVLDKMAANFFSQSMVHADAAKKELLVKARERSAAQRSACRSSSCVSDSYLGQIRETSAIMERRATPPK
jgi:hypothetical protein